MSDGKIVYTDGSEVALEQFVDGFSASLFQTCMHHDLCAQVARMEVPDEATYKVLHNLLSVKSRVLMAATALLESVGRDAASIRRVVLPPLVARAIGERLEAHGVGVEELPENPPLVPAKVAVSFALKVVFHRLYRLLARPMERGVPAVRSWVEVTEGMYGQLFESSQLRVFPFSFGLRRQVAFVRSLMERRLRWSLDGIPYRLRDGVAALFARRDRHLVLARGERIAYERYANELIDAGVQEIYTSDDFEIGAVSAGDRLLAAGASFVNTAHGIGLHCPEVTYSIFHYMNEYSAEFYRRKGNPMELRKRVTANARMPFLREQLQENREVGLVYVHQNFEHYHLPSEAAAQRRILSAMSEVARQLGIPAAVKLHPNMSLKEVQGQLPDNLQVIARWSEASRWRSVFLTVYSTTYYELLDVAPVLVYAGPTYNPAVYLDGEFQTFDEHDLRQKVAILADPAAWAELVDRQVRSVLVAA